jgi:hypothetical protein
MCERLTCVGGGVGGVCVGGHDMIGKDWKSATTYSHPRGLMVGARDTQPHACTSIMPRAKTAFNERATYTHHIICNHVYRCLTLQHCGCFSTRVTPTTSTSTSTILTGRGGGCSEQPITQVEHTLDHGGEEAGGALGKVGELVVEPTCYHQPVHRRYHRCMRREDVGGELLGVGGRVGSVVSVGNCNNQNGQRDTMARNTAGIGPRISAIHTRFSTCPKVNTPYHCVP